MKPVFKSKEHSIFLRRDGRHAVVNPEGQPILGEEKVAVLLQYELIKVTAAAPQPAPPCPQRPSNPGLAVQSLHTY